MLKPELKDLDDQLNLKMTIHQEIKPNKVLCIAKYQL